jgi:TRAP-type mannitol/chloroaromatic compound transport system substrate-binding protein
MAAQEPGTSPVAGPFHRQKRPVVPFFARSSETQAPEQSGETYTTEVSMENRRRFILKGATLVAAGAAAATVNAPFVHAQQRFQWRMSTTWTPALDVLQGAAQRLGKSIDEMSGGRLKIQVFAGGELMPPFGCFDATSQGTIECFMGAPYYWAGKEPGLQWFSAVPFGLNPQGMMTWYLHGDGLKLWEEAYANFGLVPRPGPSTGVQMAGWFRKKINTIADFKGLKMRIPGLGGKIVAAAGGTVVLTPGGEIYTALERGVIDSTEWVGPHDDMKLGLHNAARYYYYPGWHEPGTTAEFGFNKKAYDSLPADLKSVVDHACQSVQVTGLNEYESKNTVALQKLKTDFKSKVEILPLSSSTLKELKKLSDQVVKEESEKSPMAKKAYASVNKLESQLNDWRLLSEAAYHTQIAMS